jgi:hypothetical protein
VPGASSSQYPLSLKRRAKFRIGKLVAVRDGCLSKAQRGLGKLEETGPSLFYSEGLCTDY